MTVRTVLLAVIIFSIFSMFFEGFIVFRNLKNKLHAYLFLNCIAMLISNTGYLLQLLSKTEDAYIAALKFSYVGRVWIVFSLFMFTAQLVHINIPRALSGAFILIDAAVYVLIFSLQEHTLYYSKIWFDKTGMFPVLLHRNGIVHKVFMQYQAIAIIIMLFLLIRSVKNHSGSTARKRACIILGGFFISATLYIMQIAHAFFITYYFDISVVGNVAITISMFIAIFRYNLLGVIDMARDYIVDRLSEGVIALDESGSVQYYNEHAKELYPEITKDPMDVVNALREAIIRGDTIKVGDKYYTPEEKELFADGEVIGKLYALVDSTVLKQREYQLKSDAAILEMAAGSMRDRLNAAEELISQDRAMRHDRRHFEALVLALIQDGKVDEARKCLEERLSQEPRGSHRYCENTTVNAALMHYVTLAERSDIKVTVSTNIPYKTDVDEMQLAIAISNLLENAIHACEKVPEGERFIEVTAKYKQQLLLEISNSCNERAELDEDGHPVTSEDGHGIGTRSVLDFVKKTNSEIRYVAEDNKFKVRMIVG
ncbi:histidine kinase N-terminal 7TM domain-containing protein [Butyrivibrio sp. WCD2001]|uniref:histidine kinase N-terminal 7TM domain-containing protein n=1 Tax=Butyrivibrio sp. WCD2001 TaxID=1280681 RepID=UPI000677F0DB|nr:histidine kinase N-terminal 7TM domain-containing protein [Butyrivibrio sp. WCD2001]